jgi:nitroimidazol reductase NimA-like FMN-containing flavoprotein (pyridoxamine 5'-phosphate oxidase superfamily)
MNRVPRELSREECERLIAGGGVGRVGLSTDAGPLIIPVNFVVQQGTIVFRTDPHSVVATHGWGRRVAFEVDAIDAVHATGWDVLVVGRLEPVDDPGEIALLERRAELRPWPAGRRRLHMRVAPLDVTGRSIGPAE